MNILLVALNAKYIHSNPAIYSLAACAKDYVEDGNTVNCTRECGEATRDYMLSVCEDIKKPFAGLVWELNGVGETTLAVFSTNKYRIEEIKE